MNNVIPLQNSPERVSLLPIAPGGDFATALSLRRMATSTGATPAYLLAPEVSALLFYMPDQRHHMLFATLWNTGMRIGEARMLTPESFDLDGVRPFVRILSENCVMTGLKVYRKVLQTRQKAVQLYPQSRYGGQRNE